MCWYGKFGYASTWCTLPIVVQVGNLVVGRVLDAKSCVHVRVLGCPLACARADVHVAHVLTYDNI